MIKKSVAALLLLLITVAAIAQIKVACVGNSITFGHGLQKEQTYPYQLGQLLGSDWEVRNYGVSGRTLLKNGDFPYIKEKAFADAKAFSPDVVIIKLGTNDSKPQNWKFSSEFIGDYAALINEFKALPSKPVIFICLPVPAYGVNFRISDSTVNTVIPPMIRTIAKENKVKLIDLQGPLSNHAEWFPDKIHPTAPGAAEIANVVAANLKKNKKKIKKRK